MGSASRGGGRGQRSRATVGRGAGAGPGGRCPVRDGGLFSGRPREGGALPAGGTVGPGVTVGRGEGTWPPAGPRLGGGGSDVARAAELRRPRPPGPPLSTSHRAAGDRAPPAGAGGRRSKSRPLLLWERDSQELSRTARPGPLHLRPVSAGPREALSPLSVYLPRPQKDPCLERTRCLAPHPPGRPPPGGPAPSTAPGHSPASSCSPSDSHRLRLSCRRTWGQAV